MSDDKWKRLKDVLELNGEAGTAMLNIMRQVEHDLDQEEQARQARFASYMPARDPNEPHDKHCQITRWGAKPGVACTCESNVTRRRQQVANAARAGDMEFRATLGGMEQHAFDMARKH